MTGPRLWQVRESPTSAGMTEASVKSRASSPCDRKLNRPRPWMAALHDASWRQIIHNSLSSWAPVQGRCRGGRHSVPCPV